MFTYQYICIFTEISVRMRFHYLSHRGPRICSFDRHYGGLRCVDVYHEFSFRKRCRVKSESLHKRGFSTLFTFSVCLQNDITPTLTPIEKYQRCQPHMITTHCPTCKLMTDLLHTIPDFPTKKYTHLIPSLEKSLITTTDILTLDALDVAKRAQLPLLEVRRLKEHISALLQAQLGLDSDLFSKYENVGPEQSGYGILRKNGHQVVQPRGCISTLDPALDEALGGGIQTGYVTEITGERFATQSIPFTHLG